MESLVYLDRDSISKDVDDEFDDLLNRISDR